MVNAGGWGVFRVGYERRTLAGALAEHLAELTPLERANLLADTWATTLAGRSDLRAFPPARRRGSGCTPDLLGGLPSPARSSWSTGSPPGAERDALTDAVVALFGPVHQPSRLRGRGGRTDRTPTLRGSPSISSGRLARATSVRAEASERFDRSPIAGGSGDPLPPDVESATLAVVAQRVRPGDDDALLERYRAAATPQEEMRSLGALTVFPDVDLCLRTFDLAMTRGAKPERVRRHPPACW